MSLISIDMYLLFFTPPYCILENDDTPSYVFFVATCTLYVQVDNNWRAQVEER